MKSAYQGGEKHILENQNDLELLRSRIGNGVACVKSFGCQLNVSDGEKIKGVLAEIGYSFTDDMERADIILFNTCAVRENAEERVFGSIGAIKRLKRNNPNLIIGLCGCMAQEKKTADKIKASYSFVDLIFGTFAIDKLPELIAEVLDGKKHVIDINEYGGMTLNENIKQLRDGNSFKASVPIMYGCNNFCSYCIVPYVRGRERSRKPESILQEVRELVANGCKEIMLLGQNVNSYGKDLEEKITFPELLREIDALDGDFVIRFMSSHPKDAGKELINAIIQCDKVGKHLHLPVQSGSNDILDKMNRRYTVEKYMETIDYARSIIPDFSFTTDIIVGFPNETEKDFQDTLEIMKKVRYDNIYSFIYSKRTGTKASLIDDKVSDEEKGRRMRELLALQREISTEYYKRFIGRTMRVLVDGESKNGMLCGKSSEFIIVEFDGNIALKGQFVNVKITDSKNWAVVGTLEE